MSNPDEIPTEGTTDDEPAESDTQKSITSPASNSSGSVRSDQTEAASVASTQAESAVQSETSAITDSTDGSVLTRSESTQFSETSKTSETVNTNAPSSDLSSSSRQNKGSDGGIQLFEEKEKPPCHVLYHLNDADVLQHFKDLEKNLSRIITENGVFYRFLEQNDPEALEDMATTLSADKVKKVSGSARKATLLSKSLTKRSSSVAMPQDQPHEKEPPKINYNQKSDLVMRDLEEFQARMEAKKVKLNKRKRILLANLEETETRKYELDYSLGKFEAFKQTTEEISLQKFVRFMDEWSRRAGLMADKIRLRYSSARVQYQKLAATLAHKQLIGENLREIDFENLKVENAHISEKIEMKTLLLLELKRMTGEGNLKLSQHKQLLQQKIFEKQAMATAIKKVEKDIAKSDDEIVKLYVEVDQVKDEYNRVKQKYRFYEAPDVMLYITTKMEVNGLKKDLKAWTQRMSSKEKALEIELNAMRKLLRCKEPHPSWFE